MSLLKRSNGKYASVQTRKPLARSEDLVIEEFEDDLLIYDGNNKSAHCLGATAARVWQACDGKTDVDGLSTALDLSRETVMRALEELEASELLDTQELDVLYGNGNGMTRRELTLRSAKIGAAAAAVPLVYSIAVPTAMAQASPTNQACALFSTDDCGSSGGAGAVQGCCCCCQGGGPCKIGGSISMCTSEPCPPGGTGKCSDDSCTKTGHCSQTVNGQGCCGISASGACGCAFQGGSNAGCLCGQNTQGCGSSADTNCASNCTPGAPSCGSGCCDTSSSTCVKTYVSGTSGPYTLSGCGGCAPGADGTCMPCCNGSPISQTVTVSFNCCNPGATTTCPKQVFPGP